MTVAPGQRLITLSGDLAVGAGLINLNNFAIVQTGSNDLVQLTPDASVSVAGPLLTLVDSAVTTGGTVVKVLGSLTGTSAFTFANRTSI